MQLAARPAGTWLALCLTAALAAVTAQAADHLDSPELGGANAVLDLTDLYVFRSPENRENVVIAVNHQSVFDRVGGASGTQLFANDGVYQTHVDRTGDIRADLTFETRFSGTGSAQTFKIEGLPRADGTRFSLTGPVTPLGQTTPIIVEQEGIKVFVGPRDDPAFFDLTAFQDFAGPNGPYAPSAGLRRPGAGAPMNDFRGNVASIVVEVPAVRLTGAPTPDAGTIKVWSETFRLQ